MKVAKTDRGEELLDSSEGWAARNMGDVVSLYDCWLNRAEVAELVEHLQAWLQTGSMEI
jgi:hypothetical protein